MNFKRESQRAPGLSAVPAVPRSPTIEVVSDVICPWCFIGKRRLEKALAILDRPDVAIRWMPFQLNPGAPKQGLDRQAYRIRKLGSLAYSQQLEARVAAAGSEEGSNSIKCFFHQRGRAWSRGVS